MCVPTLIRNATKHTSIQNTHRLWYCLGCGGARFNLRVWGEWKYSATHSLTSVLHIGEHTLRCIQIGRALGTHLIGGWVGVTADLAVSKKWNISWHLPRMALRLFTIPGYSSPSIQSNRLSFCYWSCCLTVIVSARGHWHSCSHSLPGVQISFA
jgi:hypothetical protein